ncbi:MAG: hypothetical protein ABR887_04035 [Methanoregulaceae archaeon]|jgi:uncharacterized protein (UPF0333 family)
MGLFDKLMETFSDSPIIKKDNVSDTIKTRKKRKVSKIFLLLSISIIIVAAILISIVLIETIGNTSNTISNSNQPVIQTVIPTSSPITSSKKPVDFTLDPGTPTNCGLTCRQTTATVTNTGDETAHNVCVVLTVNNSQGEQISLNNEPNIQLCIGDLTGGQSKSEPITINADCGAFETKCIGQTLTLKCQATSNEKTVQFPDQVISE